MHDVTVVECNVSGFGGCVVVSKARVKESLKD